MQKQATWADRLHHLQKVGPTISQTPLTPGSSVDSPTVTPSPPPRVVSTNYNAYRMTSLPVSPAQEQTTGNINNNNHGGRTKKSHSVAEKEYLLGNHASTYNSSAMSIKSIATENDIKAPPLYHHQDEFEYYQSPPNSNQAKHKHNKVDKNRQQQQQIPERETHIRRHNIVINGNINSSVTKKQSVHERSRSNAQRIAQRDVVENMNIQSRQMYQNQEQEETDLLDLQKKYTPPRTITNIISA